MRRGRRAPVPAWESVDDGGLATWVFVLVYPSFLVWGVALAATTYRYATISRPPSQYHTPLPHRGRRNG